MNLEEQDHTVQAEIGGSWYPGYREKEPNWSCERWKPSGVLGLLRAVPTSCMNLHFSYRIILSTSSRPHLIHLKILAETEEGSQKYRMDSQHRWSQQHTLLFFEEVSTASPQFRQGLPKRHLQRQQERDNRSEPRSYRFITSHQGGSTGALTERRKAPRQKKLPPS